MTDRTITWSFDAAEDIWIAAGPARTVGYELSDDGLVLWDGYEDVDGPFEIDPGLIPQPARDLLAEVVTEPNGLEAARVGGVEVRRWGSCGCCGEYYDAEAFKALKLVGVQSDGLGTRVTVKRCRECGSTLGRRQSRLAAAS